MMTIGPAVSGLKLQGGPGAYHGRLLARDRHRIRQEYAALFDRFDDPLAPEFTAAIDTRHGQKRYRLQLRPQPDTDRAD
jgi:hypothetical protein